MDESMLIGGGFRFFFAGEVLELEAGLTFSFRGTGVLDGPPTGELGVLLVELPDDKLFGVAKVNGILGNGENDCIANDADHGNGEKGPFLNKKIRSDWFKRNKKKKHVWQTIESKVRLRLKNYT